MSNKILTKRFKRNMLAAAGLAMVTPAALASAPWIGSADYKLAPGATGDEAKVGPFDTYDFGTGIALLQPAGIIQEGTTFTGYFQTMVDGHFLGANGITVNQLDISGGKNFAGSNNGFELTLTSYFNGVYTNVTANSADFSIQGGSASLYSDTNPDYNFALDTGFNNGANILSGSITGGLGSIIFPGVWGIGAEQINLDFNGIFGSFNAAVYDPDTIGGGSALFSIKTKTLLNPNTPVIDEVWNGNKKVGGILAANVSQLAELDGKLQLTAVPVPAAAWLFGSGLLGLLTAGKRKKIIG
jgi:hypothetical protein